MIIKNNLTRLIFVAFLFPCNYLLGQDNEVIDHAKYQFTYLLTYQMDSTDADNIKSEEMMLTVGEKTSKFQSMNGYLRDSIVNDVKKMNIPTMEKIGMLGDLPKSNFKEIIFKDYANNSIVYREEVLRDYFEYKEKLHIFNWVIEEERQTINGYDCQKATTKYAGRAYEAWYTQEIPISDGPYKFNGLPGLIIRIYDTKHHYLYDLIEVKKTADQKITSSKEKHIVTTPKGLSKVKRESFENVFSKLEQGGVSITFNDPSQKGEMRKIAKEKAAKKNNPIELTYE